MTGWPEPARCRHWGRHGAAGVLLVHGDRVLLGRRSRWVMHGGTFGIPGGALDPGETDVDAAYRELREETGIRITPLDERVTHRLVWSCPDSCGWFYSTITVRCSRWRAALPIDGETDAWRWIRLDEADELRRTGRLHPGLADAWPVLRRQMSEGT